MAVVEFSENARRVFCKAGLSQPYVEALRHCVHSLRVMNSKPPNSAAVRRALVSTHAAALRLKANLTKLKRPAHERSANAVAGFVLDNELSLVDDPCDEAGATLVGLPIAEELAKVQRLCNATAAAIRHCSELAPPAKKGGQPAWNATPAIYQALDSVWYRETAWHSAVARPSFLVLSHAVDSPFRRVVDACYQEAGRNDGVPGKAFEAFITKRIGQKKELLRALDAALGEGGNRIRNE